MLPVRGSLLCFIFIHAHTIMHTHFTQSRNHARTLSLSVAQTAPFFCYLEMNSAGSCQGGVLGMTDTAEGCCFPSGSGGIGAGAYTASGTETCVSCMTVICECS